MNGHRMIWACVTGIPFLVVINFVQPFILTAILDVPTQEQGSVSGDLAIAAIWCRLKYPSNTPLRLTKPTSAV